MNFIKYDNSLKEKEEEELEPIDWDIKKEGIFVSGHDSFYLKRYKNLDRILNKIKTKNKGKFYGNSKKTITNSKKPESTEGSIQ